MLAAAGATGSLHAIDIDRPERQVAVRADEPIVLSSVFKVHLVLALLRAADAGRDLHQRLTVGPGRTRGSPGLAALHDPVEISLRDLATLAITVSDVAAADALYDILGGDDGLREPASALGLRATELAGCCRDLLAGTAGDPLHELVTSRATPQDLTRLLTLIWQDRAASPAACATLRGLLAAQALRPRIAAGFVDGWQTATKSGTLGTLRNDIGVVEQAGHRYAIAISVRHDPAIPPSAADDAYLGRLARTAVDALGSQPLSERPNDGGATPR